MKKDVQKYKPLGDLFDLKREMDSLFNSRFPSSFFDSYFSDDTWAPLIDIVEDKECFSVTVELPGLKKEDIDISIDDSTLIISGKRESKKEEKEKTYHRIERSYGSFYRAISLPRDIDENKIKAAFNDGVLEVSLPKSDKSKKKQIEIK